jgi:hypothetical protein
MDFTKKLILILQMVNEWLKFSEAKNAILIAFSGTGITAISTYVSTASDIQNLLRVALYVSILLFCCSSFICSVSFLPRTNIEHIIWLKERPSRRHGYSKSLQENDNFYHFDDLKKYKNTDLLDSINKLYFDNSITDSHKKENLHLASQIVINSEITSIKFKLFTFALWIAIISIFVMSVSLLIGMFSLKL